MKVELARLTNRINLSHELHRESCNRRGSKTKAEHISLDLHALTARSYNIPLRKCVVCVNIGMRQVTRAQPARKN